MEQATHANSTLILFGKGVVRGFAIGRAIVMADEHTEVTHYHIDESEVEAECLRLEQACQQVHDEFQSLLQEIPPDAPKEIAPLLKVHSLLLQDPLLLDASKQIIIQRRYNAPWALRTQEFIIREKFASIADDYMRERIADVQQVVQRILNALNQGGRALNMKLELTKGNILVAHDIAPADMLPCRELGFSAFLTTVGGATSHTAIVARSMDIPAVVGIPDLHHLVHQQDLLIVDGEQGVLIINPTEAILTHYQHKQAQYHHQRQLIMSSKGVAKTLDNHKIALYANIEYPEEVDQALEMGAEGIGLFRSEFLFMGRDKLPSEQEQYEAYRYVLEKMGNDRPVTIRTLDLGQDKLLDDQRDGADSHTALGLRAIRYCLAHPELFLLQLKALYRAALHGQLKVMLPMISHIHELQAVEGLLKEARHQLVEAGCEFGLFELGAMVEVPATALAINSFLKRVAFASIGTNDLIQYTMAIDRGNSHLSNLYDPLHPGVLKLIWQTILAGQRFGKPVSVCGEMAGDTRYTRLLLGMGLRYFSMHPSSIPEVRQIIQQSHTETIHQLIVNDLHDSQFLDLEALGI